MIGPSSNASSAGDGASSKRHHHNHNHHHRLLLDELDIEGICDEVCGHHHNHHHHHHHHQQNDDDEIQETSLSSSSSSLSKRPRYASELAASMLIEHDVLAGLPTDQIYASYFEPQHHHHHQHHQQQQEEQHHQIHMINNQQQQTNNINGSIVNDVTDISEQQSSNEAQIAKLEVLVVDGTWDDALEGFDTAGITTSTQSCSSLLTELTSDHNLQQQHHNHNHHHHNQIPSLQAVNYQNSYWSQSPNQQQQQQEQQQQQPQIQQVQSLQTMPKTAQHCVDLGRQRSALAPLSLGIPNYEDQENGNLSWLLDFKLDSFIEAPEDKSAGVQPRDFHGIRGKFNLSSSSSSNSSNGSISSSIRPQQEVGRKSCLESSRCDGSHSPDDGRKVNCSTGPKKPPFTYTELIEHALQERGELTVSAIYQWISEHFPYYKSNDDRWKNSVRHNLSINPHFRKGSKAPHGAGHLWAIASQDETRPRQLFNIASIRQALRNEEANSNKTNSQQKQQQQQQQPEPLDEVAAATASISQPPDEDEDEDNDITDAITLEHCAEQILSGIKKEVEVQYLVPMMVASSANNDNSHGQHCQSNGTVQTDSLCPIKETDFLNPVSKEVVAEECGLLGEGYLVTDLNPASLGLNMAEPEVVSADNLFGEELSLQFYEFAAASSQLQSA